MNVVRTVCALWFDDAGATLAEYALVLGILSVASLTVLFAMGASATNQMNSTQTNATNNVMTPP
jgi:Flp pilus assembly pilin Flp